jgi:hypothetical protein
LIEILLIRLSLRVNRISIKGQRRRGICKADKGGAGAVGLVSIEPGVGIWCFGAHNSSSGICRRPAGRTRGDHTKDSSSPGERRHPIHRRERRRPRCTSSKVGEAKAHKIMSRPTCETREASKHSQLRRESRGSEGSGLLYLFYETRRSHKPIAAARSRLEAAWR